MKSPVAILTLAAAALAAGCVTSLRAQAGPRRVAVPISLLAIALNDLEFTGVLPGIPKSVNVHDPRYSALFEIQGQPNASVRVELVLPGALSASAGAMLPIVFGPGDGFADYSRGQTPLGVTFNPYAPLISTLSTTGQIYVRLGGTVLPGRPQNGGEYRATIILTVYDLGT
jgi:hypothetical protein